MEPNATTITRPEATPEPDPSGTIDIDVQGTKVKMVPVSALVAERKSTKEATEARLRQEFEPVQAKAAKTDQLAADLEAIRPQLAYLQEHPELLEPKGEPGPSVTDEDAESFARQYELYSATGLDVKRAKKIIADNRADMARVASEAAAQAVQPALQATAQQISRQNFLWAAQQRGQDGRFLVDTAALAEEWAKLPAELTAKPEVAQHVLKAAIGEWALSGKQTPPPSDHEPLFSEPAGGGHAPAYRISDLERKVAKASGINEDQWAASAKQYQPDRLNVLGD